MSFFSATHSLPEYYLISIMNSRLIAFYVDTFINSTSHCTTGDAKLIPVFIPNSQILKEFQTLFNNAINIKKLQFEQKISEVEADNKLSALQVKLDEMVEKLYGLV